MCERIFLRTHSHLFCHFSIGSANVSCLNRQPGNIKRAHKQGTASVAPRCIRRNKSKQEKRTGHKHRAHKTQQMKWKRVSNISIIICVWFWYLCYARNNSGKYVFLSPASPSSSATAIPVKHNEFMAVLPLPIHAQTHAPNNFILMRYMYTY